MSIKGDVSEYREILSRFHTRAVLSLRSVSSGGMTVGMTGRSDMLEGRRDVRDEQARPWRKTENKAARCSAGHSAAPHALGPENGMAKAANQQSKHAFCEPAVLG